MGVRSRKTHVHKCKVGYESLHFPDNFWFRSRVEGFKFDIEDGLLLGLLL